MSHLLYAENKILAYFSLDPSLETEELDSLLIPIEFVTFVHHFHYPATYYHKLFQHFKLCFKTGVTKNHLRICIDGQEVPSDVPIGLYFTKNNNFTIKISQIACSDAFKIIKMNWKKAFTLVNPNSGCDYIRTRLSLEGQKAKYELYEQGKSHQLQIDSEARYDGEVIVIKFFYEGDLIERKSEASKQKTIIRFIEEEFEGIINLNKIKIESHGQPINPHMSLKQFLDQWSYNDGYCYIKLS